MLEIPAIPTYPAFMAKKTIITDDIDGSTPAETYYFISGGNQ